MTKLTANIELKQQEVREQVNMKIRPSAHKKFKLLAKSLNITMAELFESLVDELYEQDRTQAN